MPLPSPSSGQALSLTEKYRPARFEHVVGQDEAVRYLKDRVLRESQQAILLVGPPGTGKTTLAKIYANGLLCHGNGPPGAKSDPEPCGDCTVCEAFSAGHRPFGYMEVDAARFDDPACAKEVADHGRSAPFGRFTIFIDEIHGFKDRAADALLKSVESPGKGSFFVMATTRPMEVRAALRSRCAPVNLHPLRPDRAFSLLTEICRLEQITFEPTALRMLASRAEGSPREMLKTLEQVASLGHVDVPNVGQALGMAWTTHLLDYFRALAAADLLAQEAGLAAWLEDPAVKARNLKEFLLYLHNYEIVRPALSDVVNAAFHQITGDERREIIEAFKPRARRAGMNLDDYWCDLMSFWNGSEGLADKVSFAIRRRRFNTLVNPQDAPPIPPLAPPAPKPQGRAFRARSRRDKGPVRGKSAAKKTAKAALGYLDLADAEAVYEAASFAVQHYGAPFNAHLVLNHDRLGGGDEAAAGERISSLTHELGLRLNQWGAGRDTPHWIYIHRKIGDRIVTDLAAHIPLDCGPRSIEWLRQRYGDPRPDNRSGAWECIFHEAQYRHARNSEESRMAQHWRNVRRLWASLDPTLLHWDADGERKPLVDLLAVPKPLRRPAGHLTTLRRMGTSRNLGPDRRRTAAAGRMAFLSAFKDCAWVALGSGWELKEYADRRAESERRRGERDLVIAEFPGDEELVVRRRNDELAKLEGGYPTDPHARRRSWVGWWS